METSTKPTSRAAIYCRISRDIVDERLGVQRQEEDCRARASREGFEVVDLYVDNDISASTGSKKPRPEFDRMMEDAREGRFSVVIAYSNSRLTRRPMELESLIQHHDRYGTRFLTIVSGDDNLATADGRMTARIKASVDAAEAERIAERLKRAKRQAAEQGKWLGTPRPYGFESDGVTVRESEAEVIRYGTKAVLAGRTLAGVARDLNEQGSTTSRGKPWSYNRLRDVLVRPRNAGLVSRGPVGREGMEIVGPAAWPAIVDPDQFHALYAVLMDPSRRKQNGNEGRWLGSGLYRCGLCGEAMRPAPYGGTAKRPESRKYLYRCTASAHLTISARQTDEYVRQVVAERLRDPRVIDVLAPRGDLTVDLDRERRSTLTARLASFERDYALGDITGAQLAKATAVVTEEIKAIDDRLGKAYRRSTASPILTAPDPGAAFLAAPLDVQRAVLSALVRVEVQPALYRGAAWSPDRLRLVAVADL